MELVNFEKIFVPARKISDDACKCEFCDVPCLKADGFAIGESDTEEVELYFPILKKGRKAYRDLKQAIAVFRTPEGSVSRVVEIAGYDQAVSRLAWQAGDDARLYYLITRFKQDPGENSFAEYCLNRMLSLSSEPIIADLEEIDRAYAFYEELWRKCSISFSGLNKKALNALRRYEKQHSVRLQDQEKIAFWVYLSEVRLRSDPKNPEYKVSSVKVDAVFSADGSAAVSSLDPFYAGFDHIAADDAECSGFCEVSELRSLEKWFSKDQAFVYAKPLKKRVKAQQALGMEASFFGRRFRVKPSECVKQHKAGI